MHRRAVLRAAVYGVLAAPLDVPAQPAQKLPRVALLANSPQIADMEGPEPRERNARAFVQGLRELGWIEGKNIVIERRSALGRPERIPALVQEVVDLRVDLMITYGTAMALTAKQAGTIPVVALGLGDPVASGLVGNLARPGGNVTGLTMEVGPLLNGKRLELLKALSPKMARVVFIRPRPRAGARLWAGETEEAARSLGITLSVAVADLPEDLDAAFAQIARDRPDAIYCPDYPMAIGQRRRIIDFAARERLPAVYAQRLFAESGGLMSYGADLPALSRRAAAYVDKILKGAKPGDLPFEQPTKFELVINAKTAKALGLAIPPSLRLRADEVID